MQQNELPEGWAECEIREIADINYGKGLKKSDRTEGKFDVFGSNGVIGKHNQSITHGPTIIVGRKGSVGEINLSLEPCWPIDTTYYIDHFDGINKVFLYYLLKTLNLANYDTSTAIPGINRNDIYSLKISLPPLPEQHRIVTAIEALFSRLDATNERLDRMPGIMKNFRQAVLAAACEGRLTDLWRNENQETKLENEILNTIDSGSSLDSEIILNTFNLPDTWRWTTVGSIGFVKGGKRLQKGSTLVNFNTSYPYLRAGNLKNGTVEGDILYLQPHDYNPISKYTISSSDVYITIVGACIGDSGIIPEEYDGANLTENAAKVCNLRGIYNQYLALVFQSDVIQDQIQKKIFSASQGKLALSRIRQILIPLPPLPEQQEIVRRVDALFAFADSIEAKVAVAREKTERLRQSILAKAFSGELVPTEAELARQEGREYESAEVLLERIKMEGKGG